jgi:hypothetical protein
MAIFSFNRIPRFLTFVILFCTMSFGSFSVAKAQMSIPEAESIFIYNFTRLIEWPSAYKTGDFVIGVLGQCDFYRAVSNYTEGKRAGAQAIVVKKFNSPQEITRCQMIFIPYSKSKMINDVIAQIEGKSTLIITEKNGMINAGSGINFLIGEDRLKFELRKANVTKYGLKVTSNLETMAVLK